jgi:hypothetical protein
MTIDGGRIARTLTRGIRTLLAATVLGAMVTVVSHPPAGHVLIFDGDTNVDNRALTACAATLGDCSLRGTGGGTVSRCEIVPPRSAALPRRTPSASLGTGGTRFGRGRGHERKLTGRG